MLTRLNRAIGTFNNFVKNRAQIKGKKIRICSLTIEI